LDHLGDLLSALEVAAGKRLDERLAVPRVVGERGVEGCETRSVFGSGLAPTDAADVAASVAATSKAVVAASTLWSLVGMGEHPSLGTET
jgi:hypothetical protein